MNNIAFICTGEPVVDSGTYTVLAFAVFFLVSFGFRFALAKAQTKKWKRIILFLYAAATGFLLYWIVLLSLLTC